MSQFDASLRALLSTWAGSTPDSTAIAAPGRTDLTYRQLLATIDGLGSLIRHHGLDRNDVVGLVVPNGPEAATSFLGVSAHAIAAPMNIAYRAAELEFAVQDVGMRAVVVLSDADGPIREVAARNRLPVIELSPGEAAGSFRLQDGESAEAAEPDDIALILHTSGTTSRPKAVPLRHRNLTASARHIATTLDLTPADRCLNVMPLFHIHGLMAALLASLHSGASVVCTTGFSAPDFFGWMETHRPTWYTAVPTMHQAILERASEASDIIASTPLRFARSSSASLPASVMDALEGALGAPVIEAYGMTEASHQMTSNPLPPAERRPGTVGLPAGPEVAIMDDDGNLVLDWSEGEVVIRGPNVTSGYLNAEEANAAAFTNGWFRTGDLGVIDSDGYLRISGRRKEIINRGGETIAPREIDEALLAHPDVRQALAFSVPDDRLGEQVAAAVVLRDGAEVGEIELRQFASVTLTASKVPRKILVLDDIPKGPTGKLQRIGMADRLGLEDLDAAAAVDLPTRAPATAVERLLADLWHEVLGRPAQTVDIGFLDLGGDSILATRLLAAVRDRVAIDVDMIEFFDRPTIYQQAVLIEDRLLAEDQA